MKFTHPDGTHDIVAVPGTMLLGEVVHDPDGVWVTIGYIGSEGRQVYSQEEWDAFKALVAEIDEAMK